VKDEQAKTKIVVIGGTGLIGSKVVANLRDDGFDAVAASPDTGVNTLTGEGLGKVLEGASVVVDVSNSPSFEDTAVMDFFKTSTGNLLRYEAEAGVKHHVVLSVVGSERLPEVGYYRAKVAQEALIKESSIPYSIVHATQFYEFAKGIADSSTDGNIVRLPPILIQPIAAEDVAKAVTEAAEGTPLNATVEIAGPDVLSLNEFVQKGLDARSDKREIVTDPDAPFFGAVLTERSLLPGKDASLSKRRFEDWLTGQAGPVAEQRAKQVKAAAE
jgi:uncharacterized protein YbjT (DUF2867 family)